MHEFAHHLDWCRKGKRGHLYHDAAFHACLVAVATAWYGDAALYDWSSEYATIKAAGPRWTPTAKVDALFGELEAV